MATRRARPGRLAATELFLALDDHPGRSLRHRLAEALKDAVRTGRLPAGARLPSSRALASDLGLSRGVVVDAYAQLTAEGFLVSAPGSATLVMAMASPSDRAAGARPGPEPERGGPGSASLIDLRPGPPDLSAFPRALWAAATRDVLRQLPDHELGYVPPWGAEELRAGLAPYLARARGAMVAPQDLVVVSGVTQGLSLLVRVLVAQGTQTVAVESPSHAGQRVLLAGYGARVLDVPTDDDGIDVDFLARSGARVVVVTPAHQYPTGVVLSSARRGALVRWAEQVDGLIVEDDYDAEFRYERLPVGCVQGLAPSRAALLGSLSKTLVPGLRLGWLVPPKSLLDGVRAAKRNDDFGSDVLVQNVFAHLLRTGAYDRHLRHLRSRYRTRRDAVLDAVARELPDWTVEGKAAGLHVLLRPPLDVAEGELLVGAARHGVDLQGVAQMYGTLPARAGILLGYSRASAAVLEDAVRRLAEAARSLREPDREGPPPRNGAAVRRRATAEDYF